MWTEPSTRGEFFGLFELANRRVSANVEFAGSSAGGSIEFTGLVDRLTPAEFADLLRQHSGFNPPGGGLPAGIVELQNVTMNFAAGGDTSFGISANAVYEVEIDGQTRRFSGPADFNLSGGQLDVSLDAGLDEPWEQPFGVSWLTLEDVSFQIAAGSGQATGTYQSFFMLGSKRVDLQIELTGGSGGSSARLIGSVDQLSMQDFTQLVQKQLPNEAPFDGSNLNLTFSDVTMTLEVGGSNAFSIGATTTLNGRTADLLFSATSKAGQPQILTGFQLHDWSLADAVPALQGSLVEQLEFETVALLLTKATGRLDASDLSLQVYDFYRAVNTTDDFTLKLQPGVSVVGKAPLPSLPSSARPLIRSVPAPIKSCWQGRFQAPSWVWAAAAAFR